MINYEMQERDKILMEVKMNNFEMQKQAQVLTDTRTPNQLARMYLEAREDLKEVEAILDKLETVLPCDIDEILIDLELSE